MNLKKKNRHWTKPWRLSYIGWGGHRIEKKIGNHCISPTLTVTKSLAIPFLLNRQIYKMVLMVNSPGTASRCYEGRRLWRSDAQWSFPALYTRSLCRDLPVDVFRPIRVHFLCLVFLFFSFFCIFACSLLHLDILHIAWHVDEFLNKWVNIILVKMFHKIIFLVLAEYILISLIYCNM